jgi:glycosyltransferase involved in cell wall biosynthesis
MIKLLLKGPLLTQSGYGHHARTVLRALRTKEENFDIYIHPIVWGQTSWLWEDSEERQWIDESIKKTVAHTSQGGQFDLAIQVTIPNEWEKLAPINIGVTAGIEATRVAPKWIEKSFLMDKILTISQFAKDTYINTVYEAINNQTNEKVDYKVQTEVDYIHYPVRLAGTKSLDLNLTTDFNFLCVAQLGPRKNTEQLIKCFIEKFKDNENIGLVIKANITKNSLLDRTSTTNMFRTILNRHGDRKCKLYLLHGFLTDEEMNGLYTHPKIKALVSATHGEGYGLPLFEAAYNGLPVIATDWSGHLDFLYMKQKQKNGKEKLKHMFNRITYSLNKIPEQSVWKDVLVPDAMWAYPEEGSIKTNLEEVYKDHGRFKKRAKQLQKWIYAEFSEEKIYNRYIELLEPFTQNTMQDEVDELFNQLSLESA